MGGRGAAVQALGTAGPRHRLSQGLAGLLRPREPDRARRAAQLRPAGPGGYGELCSGSEREYDYTRIVSRIRETGENPAKYAWYLDLLREGIPASAGFGIGLERFTRYVAGLDSVWQASAFPKLPGVVSP
ncbi:amino acid--tRNA ligase-related protein [Streptomyces sp. M10(2022)]